MARDVPMSIKREAFLAALADLDIEHENLLSLTSDPHSVSLVYRRVDEQGFAVAAGDKIATETIVIGLD